MSAGRGTSSLRSGLGHGAALCSGGGNGSQTSVLGSLEIEGASGVLFPPHHPPPPLPNTLGVWCDLEHCDLSGQTEAVKSLK